MNKFITYNGLPIKSGGAHSISNKSPEEIYHKTNKFLNLFTDNKHPKYVKLYLAKTDFILFPKLCWFFGIPKLSSNNKLNTWYWSLNQKKIEKGLKLLELNTNSKNILTLSLYWNFKFKDFKTGNILPNQKRIPTIDSRNENSKIYLRISKKSTISVWFAFPFEEIKEYEKEYINNLKDNLPFKVSNKHWRTWNKSEKGNWIPRKLEL